MKKLFSAVYVIALVFCSFCASAQNKVLISLKRENMIEVYEFHTSLLETGDNKYTNSFQMGKELITIEAILDSEKNGILTYAIKNKKNIFVVKVKNKKIIIEQKQKNIEIEIQNIVIDGAQYFDPLEPRSLREH